jgi:hypothetical protein
MSVEEITKRGKGSPLLTGRIGGGPAAAGTQAGAADDA